jgi:hypothetical protein
MRGALCEGLVGRGKDGKAIEDWTYHNLWQKEELYYGDQIAWRKKE